MKKTILLALIVILLVSCSKKDSNSTTPNQLAVEDYTTGGDIFPIKIGNTWNYSQDILNHDITLSFTTDYLNETWDGYTNDTRMMAVANKSDGSGGASDFNLNMRHLSKQPDGIAVGEWRDSAQKIITVYFLPNQPVVGKDSYGNTWSQVDAVQTTKGTYKYCWKYAFGKSLYSEYFIYKKGIGIIEAKCGIYHFNMYDYSVK